MFGERLWTPMPRWSVGVGEGFCAQAEVAKQVPISPRRITVLSSANLDLIAFITPLGRN